MSYASAVGSYGWNEQAKAQEEARRQAEIMERQRQEQMQWERQRQLTQERILQQEQDRRGRESDGKLSNEQLGINKNYDLGIYQEGTKRLASNATERMDQRRMSTMDRAFSGIFGQQPGAPSLSLYDSGGRQVGGTFPRQGAGAVGGKQFSYRSPANLALRESLLRNG